MYQLPLNFGALTAKVWIAPGNYRSICQDRPKGTTCGLNLLDTAELTTDPSAKIAANAKNAA